MPLLANLLSAFALLGALLAVFTWTTIQPPAALLFASSVEAIVTTSRVEPDLYRGSQHRIPVVRVLPLGGGATQELLLQGMNGEFSSGYEEQAVRAIAPYPVGKRIPVRVLDIDSEIAYGDRLPWFALSVVGGLLLISVICTGLAVWIFFPALFRFGRTGR